jgi:hypothetical protein
MDEFDLLLRQMIICVEANDYLESKSATKLFVCVVCRHVFKFTVLQYRLILFSLN